MVYFFDGNTPHFFFPPFFYLFIYFHQLISRPRKKKRQILSDILESLLPDAVDNRHLGLQAYIQSLIWRYQPAKTGTASSKWLDSLARIPVFFHTLFILAAKPDCVWDIRIIAVIDLIWFGFDCLVMLVTLSELAQFPKALFCLLFFCFLKRASITCFSTLSLQLFTYRFLCFQ